VDSNDFNVLQLEQYLTKAVPTIGRVTSCEKFPDGQSNPTYLLSCDSGQFVLRKKPVGKLLKSAHAIEREFRVIDALQHSGVAVPVAIHLCEDPSIVGTSFYLMSYANGLAFWNPAAPGLKDAERTRLYSQMVKTLAAIHQVDVYGVGLESFGKPGNYYARQYTRWVEQYRATETRSLPQMESTIEWLEHNMVEDDGQTSLVHGDFRIDNMLFKPGSFEVVAVLDWELSTLGHPYADLSYQCALWRMPPEAALSGLKGVNRHAIGLPEDEEYLDSYCSHRAIAGIDQWNFYLVFSLFRMAAIVQGVQKRAMEGNASSTRALEIGALAQPLAAEALAVIESS